MFSSAGGANSVSARDGVRVQTISEEYALPVKVERKGRFNKREIRQTTTEALPSVMIAGTDLKVESEQQSVDLSGEFAAGRRLEISAGTTASVKDTPIRQTVQVKEKGFKGCSYQRSKTTIQHQSALLSTLVAGEDAIIKAKQAIELQGVRGLIRENLTVSAPKVEVKAAQEFTITETETDSFGMSFFGSESLEAMTRGEGRSALSNLLCRLPFLNSVRQLAAAKDGADVSIGAVNMLVEGWRMASMVANACNSLDPVKGSVLGSFTDQMGITSIAKSGPKAGERIFNPRVDFGFSTSSETSTENTSVPSTFIVGKTVKMTGDVVRLKDGTQISAEAIRLAAQTMLEILPAQDKHVVSGERAGFTVSGTIREPSISSVGFSGSEYDSNVVKNRLSQLSAVTIDLSSEREMNLLGVRLEALDLALTAQKINFDSVQDTVDASGCHFGGSIGVTGVNANYGTHSQKTRQTVASVAHAKRTLKVFADELNQLGSMMQADQTAILRSKDGKGAAKHKVQHMRDSHEKSSMEASVSVSFSGSIPVTGSYAERHETKEGETRAGFTAPNIQGEVSADAIRDPSQAAVVHHHEKSSFGMAMPFINPKEAQQELKGMQEVAARVTSGGPLTLSGRPPKSAVPTSAEPAPVPKKDPDRSPIFEKHPNKVAEKRAKMARGTPEEREKAKEDIKVIEEGRAYKKAVQKTLEKGIREEIKARGEKVHEETIRVQAEKATRKAFTGLTTAKEMESKMAEMGRVQEAGAGDRPAKDNNPQKITREGYISRGLDALGSMMLTGLGIGEAHAGKVANQEQEVGFKHAQKGGFWRERWRYLGRLQIEKDTQHHESAETFGKGVEAWALRNPEKAKKVSAALGKVEEGVEEVGKAASWCGDKLKQGYRAVRGTKAGQTVMNSGVAKAVRIGVQKVSKAVEETWNGLSVEDKKAFEFVGNVAPVPLAKGASAIKASFGAKKVTKAATVGTNVAKAAATNTSKSSALKTGVKVGIGAASLTATGVAAAVDPSQEGSNAKDALVGAAVIGGVGFATGLLFMRGQGQSKQRAGNNNARSGGEAGRKKPERLNSNSGRNLPLNHEPSLQGGKPILESYKNSKAQMKATDIMKGETKHRENVKSKGIPEKQITDVGLSQPEGVLANELAKIRHWQNLRNQYLKKWRDMDSSALPDKTKDLLFDSSADKAIRRNMTPDDLAAIFKENRGVKILKENGTPFNHLGEWRQSEKAILKSLNHEKQNSIHSRLAELYQAGKHGTLEVQILKEKLGDLSRMKDAYSELIRRQKCQIEKPKL